MNNSPSPKGAFIVIDGIDGAGKSNAISALVDHCEALGETVVRTREPGGTPLAENIRELLLASGEEPVTDVAETLLMFAARHLHLENLILPSINAGKTVISDRFSDSTYAYQGAGRGVSTELLESLERHVVGDCAPDLVILMDLPLSVARSRADKRGDADRFDAESDAFMKRVQAGYRARAEAAPERYRIIDASLDPESVRSQVITAYDAWRHGD